MDDVHHINIAASSAASCGTDLPKTVKFVISSSESRVVLVRRSLQALFTVDLEDPRRVDVNERERPNILPCLLCLGRRCDRAMLALPARLIPIGPRSLDALDRLENVQRLCFGKFLAQLELWQRADALGFGGTRLVEIDVAR